jgi:hypothetical protein
MATDDPPQPMWSVTEIRSGSKAEVEPPPTLVRSNLNSGHHAPGLRSLLCAMAQSRCAPARCAGGKNRETGSQLRVQRWRV